jgi:hypothetical protein
VHYSTDELLEEIRRAASLPDAEVTGTTDAELLADADAELRDTLVPLMLGANENLYERPFDVAVTSGVASYRLNKRIAMSRINSVVWLNSDNTGYPLERITYKRSMEAGTTSTASGTPRAFFLDGGRLVLWPSPDGSGTVRIRAFVRPSAMVPVGNSTRAVTAVGGSLSSTVELRVSTGHPFSTSTVLDVVAGSPSFEHQALDVTPTATDSTLITFTGSAFLVLPVVGDYICTADTTPFPQLPVELQPALVALTAARKLRALGQLQEARAQGEEAARLVSIGVQALTPRVDTAEVKVLGSMHWRARGPMSWVTR